MPPKPPAGFWWLAHPFFNIAPEGVDDVPRECLSLVQDEEGYEVEADADVSDAVRVRREPPGSGLLGALPENARHFGKAALHPLAGPAAGCRCEARFLGNAVTPGPRPGRDSQGHALGRGSGAA